MNKWVAAWVFSLFLVGFTKADCHFEIVLYLDEESFHKSRVLRDMDEYMSLDQEIIPTSLEQIGCLNPDTLPSTIDQIKERKAEAIRALWTEKAMKSITNMNERGMPVSLEMAISIMMDSACLHNPDEMPFAKTWSISLFQSVVGNEKAEYVGIAEIRTNSNASLVCAGHEGAAYLLRFIKFDKADLRLEEEYPKALNQLIRFLRNYVSSKFPGIQQHLYFEGDLRSLNPSISIEAQKQFYLNAGFEQVGTLLHAHLQ